MISFILLRLFQIHRLLFIIYDGVITRRNGN